MELGSLAMTEPVSGFDKFHDTTMPSPDPEKKIALSPDGSKV
jgi:hypothetical protein